MSGPVQPPLRVETVDGTTSGRPITTIKVTNGDLSISGSVATIDTSGGGGGGTGTVTSVSTSQAFITITDPTTTPSISIGNASGSATGVLTAADWTTFNSKGSGTVSSVGTSQAFITITNPTSTPSISIGNASASATGVLTSTDWNTFNNKGSGTIGGSITSTQVARGATTADEIEGDNGLLFDGTSFTVNTLSANDPVINMASNTKSVSLECETSQTLSIKGGSNKFIFDASSATSGITFPDGTTQITASTGGSVSFPLLGSSGNSTAPTYSFSADTDTGIYLSGASNMGVVAGGNSYLSIGSLGAVQLDRKALFNSASAGAPNGFVGDTDTGFFQPSSNAIGFATGGTEKFRIGSSGELIIGGASAGTSGQVLTSNGSSSSVSWEDAGGGGAYNVLFDGDINFTISATTSFQPLYGMATGYGTDNISTNAFRSFFFYRSFYAWKSAKLTHINYYVNTAQTGASMDIAIYDSDSDGRPDKKIGSVSTADLATSGIQNVSIIEESTNSMILTKGNLYWIGVKDNSSGASPIIRGFDKDQLQPLGFSNLGSTGAFVGYTTLLGTSTAGSTFSFFGVSQNNGLSLGGEYA